MKNDEFIFVVFSHADSEEKQEFLVDSLNSLKQLHLPILLASHLPVSMKAQNLVDYFLKDSDNLIVSEEDIFNPYSFEHVTPDLYYVHDHCAGLRFSTNTFKKTYQPGVFNLYINSIGIVKKLGFKNIILWEFDFALGKESKVSLENILKKYKIEDTKYFFFESFIQDLPCMNAIPSIFNTDIASSLFPTKPIKDAKEFVGVSNLMIVEQWMLSNFKKTMSKFIRLDFGDFHSVFPDLIRGQIHSQNGNYMFFSLRSGIYFSDSCDKMLYYTMNCSQVELKSSLKISDPDGVILYENAHDTKPSCWAFDNIPEKILQKCYSEQGIFVQEVIQESVSMKTSNFRYSINSRNLSYISKLKKFANA